MAKHGKFTVKPVDPNLRIRVTLGHEYDVALGKTTLDGKPAHVHAVGHATAGLHRPLVPATYKDEDDITIVRYTPL